MTTKPDVPTPPAGLSREAQAWWRRISTGWQLDDGALLILTLAVEAFDRMRAAQRLIKREGLTVKGRGHPACVVERDSRLALLKALRALNLDIEPLRDRPGRPPGRGGV